MGGHTVSVRPDFSDLPEDYFLLAVLDGRSKVAEENEVNNQLLFAGGTFKAADGSVQIHGTPHKDTLKLRDWGTHLDVELNGALSVHVSSYAAVYVRTHGSDDALIVHSPSEPAASIWAVDQYGADLLIEAGVGDERVVTRGVGGTTPVDGAAGGDGIQPLGGRDGGPAPGDLDVTFDEGLEPAGVVLTDFIGLIDRAYDVAMQPYGDAGKIVVSGKTYYMGYMLGLTCYNADGSLDDNGANDSTPGDWFGVGGKVTTPLRYSNTVPMGMVIQADGKIVVGGTYGSGTALARYNANGSLDDNGPNDSTPGDWFGTGGIAPLGIAVRDLVIDAQGGILAAGLAYNGSNWDFALTRLNSQGQLDTSFGQQGDNGIVKTDFGNSHDCAMALVLDNAGKIVVGGYSSTHGSYDFAVVRYGATGTLDETFDTDGKVVFPDFGPDPGQGSDYAYAVAIQPADPEHPELPDYYVVLAGEAAGTGGAADFGLVRCDQAGNHDTSFGGAEYQGLVTTDFGGIYDAAWGVAIGQDGRIVAAGNAHTGTDTNYDFGLVRYNFDGRRDTGFGTAGMVRTDVNQQANIAYDVVLDAEQRVVLAGFGHRSGVSISDFAVARYLYSPPDIEITGFSVNPSDSTLLDVTYEIHYAQPDEFDIGIYASFDAQTPQTLLINHVTVSDTTPGEEHTLSIPAVFRNQGTVEDPVYDLELDYFLMAKVDSQGAVAETNELNNTRLFDGGIFRDASSRLVHVHGTDVPNQDPALDKKDVVEIAVDVTGTYFQLWLNADPEGEPTIQYAKANVSQFHVRTHAGSDNVLTPRLGYSDQVSGINVPMWVFGGLGDDVIYGGDAEQGGNPEFCDRLYGGPGDDSIAGRKGPDSIYGEEDNDSLEGWAGSDTIHGGPGNDRIEGWSGFDFIYGDEGDDIITGGLDDSVDADSGDEIHGGPGNDRIDGWRFIDFIYGDEGDDEIYGGGCPDWIYGGPGNDNLFGEEGYDQIFGGDDDDFLYGGPDGAACDGEGGDDFIAGNDLSNWPGGLPWPELNLFAETEEVGDDKGPNWITTGRLADQWNTEDTTAAYGGSQHLLVVNNPNPLNPSVANWFGGVWANEPFRIYVTWAPRPEDGAENAPFYVSWFGATPVMLGPFTLNQQWAPTAYPNGIWIDNQYFAPLDVWNPQREFGVDGALWVQLTDKDVPSGQFISFCCGKVRQRFSRLGLQKKDASLSSGFSPGP